MKFTARKDIAALRQAATDRVNAAAGRARARYITVATGQEMVYLAKEAEALRFFAAYPDIGSEPSPVDGSPTGFPFLAAEVGITAPTARELALVWVQGAALFRQIGAAIETIRLGSVAAIAAAATPGELDTIEATAAAGFALLPDPS